jgi:hypothetical protein
MKLFSFISLIFSASAMVLYHFTPAEWTAIKEFTAEFRSLVPTWINNGEILTSSQLEAKRLELAVLHNIPAEHLEHPNVINSHQRYLDTELKGLVGLTPDFHDGARNGEGSVQVSD